MLPPNPQQGHHKPPHGKKAQCAEGNAQTGEQNQGGGNGAFQRFRFLSAEQLGNENAAAVAQTQCHGKKQKGEGCAGAHGAQSCRADVSPHHNAVHGVV